MTTMTKAEFTRAHRNKQIDVDDVAGANAKRAAKAADLDGNGVVRGANEMNALFNAIDRLDRDGSTRSIDLGSARRPTTAGRVEQQLERAAKPKRGLKQSGERGERGARAERGENGNNGGARGSLGISAGATGVVGGRTAGGREGVARFERIQNAGQRNQMAQGTITVNGNTYRFNSGGSGNGNLPPGTYEVTRHRDSRRDNAGMMVDGVGYSFALSDKYDSRVNAQRSLLRIHPDGRGAGTEGCIGIVGDAATQQAFRRDMLEAIRRGGGSYTLRVQQ